MIIVSRLPITAHDCEHSSYLKEHLLITYTDGGGGPWKYSRILTRGRPKSLENPQLNYKMFPYRAQKAMHVKMSTLKFLVYAAFFYDQSDYSHAATFKMYQVGFRAFKSRPI